MAANGYIGRDGIIARFLSSNGSGIVGKYMLKDVFC